MTKTWSVEVIMWQLNGQKGEDKLDPGARDSTIKRLAAYYSTPTVIEDNASSNKVRNKLGLSWAKLSPSWDWTVIKIYYIELINKIK